MIILSMIMIEYHKIFKYLKTEQPMEKENEVRHEKNDVRIDNNPDKKNPWMVSTLFFGIITLVLFVIVLRGGITGSFVKDGSLNSQILSGEEAGAKLVEFLNVRTGGGVTFVSVEELGDNLYSVTVEYKNEQVPVFVTKDGDYFMQAAVSLDAAAQQLPSQEPEIPEAPKSDKPRVELFIMTHCPYGTQAAKGIIPALKALGSDFDGNIRFVHYFMHDGESEETPVQVCLREEQSDKYLDYLACFLEDGNGKRCLDKVKVDKEKLDACLGTKADEYYNEDSTLSQNYGVRGSPTLVINGVIINSDRSPDAYLRTICSSFSEAPEACSQQLDTASPVPGFGYGAASAGSTAAYCG
jgi:protein-disulfide isomerase